jgi:hypothetical protein
MSETNKRELLEHHIDVEITVAYHKLNLCLVNAQMYGYKVKIDVTDNEMGHTLVYPTWSCATL